MSFCVHKSGVIWVGILICVCCTGVVWAEEKAAPPPDPYANVQILVEAFVVEVSTAGLQEVGVNPISQGPDGVTVAKLAACLMNETAKVISGAKASVRQNEDGFSEERRTIYYKRTNKSVTTVDNKPVTNVSVQFSPYDFKKLLRMRAIIQPDKSIHIVDEQGQAVPSFQCMVRYVGIEKSGDVGMRAYRWHETRKAEGLAEIDIGRLRAYPNNPEQRNVMIAQTK